MCGIYGEILLDPSAQASTTSLECLDRIHHRGPDEGGHWQNDGVFLGSRRLSIIDVAGGHQPITTGDGRYIIVYNGELYNFLDLKQELLAAGDTFATRTDTEVVLHAFRRWGPQCMTRFNGMYAFAIWDRDQRSLFIARDRLGEKPLYYYNDGERLVFGSEIKSIVANDRVERRINNRGLVNFLTVGHAVAPETMYENVLKLQPGHHMTVRNGAVDIVKYWDVGDEPYFAPGSQPREADMISAIRTLLDDSVTRRMIADVPVGCFLSGGIDSAAVCSLMRRHTAHVQTFSLGFEDAAGYNELGPAAETARMLGTQHHELRVRDVDLVDTLQTLVYHYDEPFGDAAGFPVLLLSRFAREHVKVVLAGDGGDELFGGYRRYSADLLAPLYQRLPAPLMDRIPGLVDRVNGARRIKRAAHALRVKDPALRYAAWLEVFSRDMREQVLLPAMRAGTEGYDPLWQYPHYYHNSPVKGNDLANKLMYIDLKTWLVDDYLEKLDKATMAASLEARLPMLDHRLVELAFQIPGSLKIRGWSRKIILKKALRGIVPDAVMKRRKRGFSVPTDPWFRGPLKNFTYEILLDETSRLRGMLDHRFVEKLWREHGSRRHVWDTQLWLLLNLELWHRAYMDKVPA